MSTFLLSSSSDLPYSSRSCMIAIWNATCVHMSRLVFKVTLGSHFREKTMHIGHFSVEVSVFKLEMYFWEVMAGGLKSANCKRCTELHRDGTGSRWTQHLMSERRAHFPRCLSCTVCLPAANQTSDLDETRDRGCFCAPSTPFVEEHMFLCFLIQAEWHWLSHFLAVVISAMLLVSRASYDVLISLFPKHLFIYSSIQYQSSTHSFLAISTPPSCCWK